MGISIITGHVERHESLHRLVQSILATVAADWELVIADGSAKPVNFDDRRIAVIEDHPPAGMVAAYNRAFQMARRDWVLWLNDDAELLPGAVDRAIEFMYAHPAIGLGCLPYSENGGPFQINRWGAVPYANFGIIRRDLGNKLGWFDRDLAMYASDNSISMKVLMDGKGVAEVPDAKLLHHAVNDERRQKNQPLRVTDGAVFTRRYRPHLQLAERTYKAILRAEGLAA